VDPNPTTALADELRTFGADEVIVVIHPTASQTWHKREELERMRRDLDMSVTQVAPGGENLRELEAPAECEGRREQINQSV